MPVKEMWYLYCRCGRTYGRDKRTWEGQAILLCGASVEGVTCCRGIMRRFEVTPELVAAHKIGGDDALTVFIPHPRKQPTRRPTWPA